MDSKHNEDTKDWLRITFDISGSHGYKNKDNIELRILIDTDPTAFITMAS